MRYYIDTSAAAKLLIQEPETIALYDLLDSSQPHLVSCYLLETELRRAAQNHGLSQVAVSTLLDDIDLYEVSPQVFRSAGLLATPGLRSLDAIHLASATRLGIDAVITYDKRMTDGAHDLGYPVLAPA